VAAKPAVSVVAAIPPASAAAARPAASAAVALSKLAKATSFISEVMDRRPLENWDLRQISSSPERATPKLK
jgi:hypothetical protein